MRRHLHGAVHNTSLEAITLTALSRPVGGGAPFAITGVAGTTCALPQTIAAGGTYSCDLHPAVSGDAGANVVDTVTATAHDNEQNPITGQASADGRRHRREADHHRDQGGRGHIGAEPGADVTYTVTVHNTSVEPVDDLRGERQGRRPAHRVRRVCRSLHRRRRSPPAPAPVLHVHPARRAATPVDVVTDTVTVTAHDNEQNDGHGNGTESVNITDVDPSMTVTKTASTTSVPEPGADVTYTVAVHNTSVETVTLTDLTTRSARRHRSMSPACPAPPARCRRASPRAPPTAARSPSTSPATPSDVVSDTVTATGHDNEDNEITGEGSESVNITDVPPTGTVTKTAVSADGARAGRSG